MLPEALSAAVPFVTATALPPAVTAVPLIFVTVIASPCGSESLARTLITTGVSWTVVAVSATAIGVGSKVTFISKASVPLPSSAPGAADSTNCTWVTVPLICTLPAAVPLVGTSDDSL